MESNACNLNMQISVSSIGLQDYPVAYKSLLRMLYVENTALVMKKQFEDFISVILIEPTSLNVISPCSAITQLRHLVQLECDNFYFLDILMLTVYLSIYLPIYLSELSASILAILCNILSYNRFR